MATMASPGGSVSPRKPQVEQFSDSGCPGLRGSILMSVRSASMLIAPPRCAAAHFPLCHLLQTNFLPMCGRFVSASPPADLARYLDADEIVAEELPASWNVAPTDAVYAVAERDGKRVLGQFKWGLVPAWSKDASGAARMINARSETLTKRFRVPFERHRCIVPADAFYEWEKQEDGTRQPFLIRRDDGAPLALAGLWDVWRHRQNNGDRQDSSDD